MDFLGKVSHVQRGGSPAARHVLVLLNSHGEGWIDDGDGRFEAGEADGDGTFSAWSGRLRGTGAAAAPRFSLAIESCASKIPVNAGFLDGASCDDLSFIFHRGLAHALDNLGALLLPEGHPRRWMLATSNPDEPIRYSLLGEDILANRPPGGYRPLLPAEVQQRFNRGRFRTTGGYTSPLYVLDRPMDLRYCQWTGIQAQGFPNSVTANLVGYENPDGTGEQFPVPLGTQSGKLLDLAATGMPDPVRSFQYTVDFVAIPLGNPLAESPVFESIWFMFRLSRLSPRWESWSA